ncbi:MAG: sulfotransferase [Candidatus Pedobacter colombiensis]|uniref:Sulfotransferase n=1 Tax=Candidatus Pedobacter colombiensis TaxID=3121371 RepID=A0AAJ6B7M7_9SPHI|nr:sulfotransferase [Pedobacter sp.]WEK19666.1 MAG: sulfotransferase [Pedobacter sp.]
MKFVDISGFGHSGKSVVTDLLKEFKGYNVPHYNFEFNLLRLQGGLIDLQHALIDNWSPIRSDSAIRRFEKLIRRIGPSANIRKPHTLFYANGMNYDAAFNGMFTEISQQYLERIVNYKYISEWPYKLIDDPPLKQFVARLQTKLKFKSQHLTEISVTSLNKVQFILETQNYLSSLFDAIKNPGDTAVVMHNAFEPYNPVSAMNFFSNSKLIVVQRDPRDIYASVTNNHGGYVPKFETSKHWKLKQSMLVVNDLDRFCEQQLVCYNHVVAGSDINILRLRFEDIVLNYESVLEKIYAFLGETKEVHNNKGRFFKPELSMKNIGLWKSSNNMDGIAHIEKVLGEQCYYE